MRIKRWKLLTTTSFTLLLLTFSPSLTNSLTAPAITESPIQTTPPPTEIVVKRDLPTTTTTTVPLSPEQLIEKARAEHGPCGEFYETAIAVGWPAEEWPQLSKIMFRESRCLPEACSESDSGRVCRDWGLMQINEYSWRRTILSHGYQMKDMWNPQHNLSFALWLWHNYGWGPWKFPAA